VVVDHNTTPSELVTDPIVRKACEKARLERNNLFSASHVATDSEFSRDALLELGMEPDGVTVLHLPPANSFIGRGEHTFDSQKASPQVRITYVGRLVKAKGLTDLLSAITSHWEAGDAQLHLTIAGSTRFSDPEVIGALHEAYARYGSDRRLSLMFDADDDDIAALYGQTDVFVIPSQHEGYCVPVVEAMTSGCYVIGSDAGNVPIVMGGLGTVFGVGNIEELSASIGRVASRIRKARVKGEELLLPTSGGDMSLSEWQAAVDVHLLDYSTAHFEVTFLKIMRTALAESAEPYPDWLTMLDQASRDTSSQPA
jgi:glycosyltransferase involved in cell wall biosynthesis